MKLVKEHINFQRNIDPKEAMGTGAWLNLRERSVLKGKKVSSSQEILNNYENYMQNCYFEIVDVEKDVIRRKNGDAQKRQYDLEIQTHMFMTLQNFEKAKNYDFWVFCGNYDQFKNCFEIIKL